MTGLQEIKQAIDELPKDKAFACGERLHKHLEGEWDMQFERDVASRRLNEAAREAIQEYRAG
jgi:hypothetical protein